MKRGFYTIMAAQFFSSLADNALFIAAIALIMQLQGPAWMTPMVKWVFALSYVLLAAFVGAYADSKPKGTVMFQTNLVKIAGCGLMFFYDAFGMTGLQGEYVVFLAYALVGVGAAAYSPAKYGILTELLPPEDLVKGNGWIEALTVLSIIFGTVLGGVLISPKISAMLLSFDLPGINTGIDTPPEAAICVIMALYAIAAGFNLAIPDTGARYPKQERNPVKLVNEFAHCVRTLWKDKLGQISLAVTTLFWGAGATLQLIVIEWGRQHLGLPLNQASILMGVAALGTIVGAVIAGKFVTLKRALSVLPVGIAMGLVVMLMPLATNMPFVYALLIVVGGLGGFFVVPMNALLQHRGHVLLSAGHSIAVQNFNEQLNILVMVAAYSLLLGLKLHVNTIIIVYGLLVAGLMLAIMAWNRANHRADPNLDRLIGSAKHH
ncbi:lysophospholipid transporter LplT [Piscinibacterium candidicorallinum]|jgi:MFS family permease|uniref:Lysophospholipid transporter LplT n=1 Tax=Piscinibacterium candidicorallinum TaxID=1793872 RepID=A0ABV7H2W5_9BURK